MLRLASIATRFAASAAARPSARVAAPRPSLTRPSVRNMATGSDADSHLVKIRTAFDKAGLSKENFSWSKLTEAFKQNPELQDSFVSLKDVLDKKTAPSSGLTYYPSAKPPVRVTVTGASGAIGYAMLYRIANGEMLGKDQPVILQLLELPQAMNALKGVEMELADCAFPLLKGVVCTDDPETAFRDANFGLLVGAKPRSKGQERADLVKENGKIFTVQGKAINKTASKDIKVLVVGNPANTNCLIAATHSPSINPRQFSAMTRLDHNRGLAQISDKIGLPVETIYRFAVWGNHSPTMYPDISHAYGRDQPLKSLLEEKWVKETFIPVVQQRGTAIINARGASSAASAASAAIDHMRDWVHGTGDRWTSMAVVSDGSYNTTKGLYYSFPVRCAGGNYSIVQGLDIDSFSAEKLLATDKELRTERDAVADQL